MGKTKSITVPADTGNCGNVTLISAARSKSNAPAADVPDKAKAADASLVVFGRDDSGKPHASWFGGADTELATKAAALMGFKVLSVTTNDHHAAAAGLPAGRIFTSGKGFVPFCREAAYEALEAFPEAFQAPPPLEPEPEPALVVTGTPQRWADIVPGSLVLASMGAELGWFESVIVEARGEDLFVLRWRDWPDDPEFARRLDGLALLPAPAIAAA